MQIDRHSCYYFNFDYRLMVPTHLACEIGNNATMVLSQIIFWVNNPRSGFLACNIEKLPNNTYKRIPIGVHTKNGQLVYGKKWIRDSIKDFHKWMQNVSYSEIRKSLQYLTRHQYIYSANLNKYLGFSHNDRTNWYAVNFYKLNKMYLNSSFVPTKYKMKAFHGALSDDKAYLSTNDHNVTMEHKPDLSTIEHERTSHFTPHVHSFYMRCSSGMSRDVQYTKNKKSSKKSSKKLNSQLASSVGDNDKNSEADTSAYNDQTQSKAQDQARPNRLSMTEHSGNASIPSGLPSEKERIAAEKKEVSAFNQPKTSELPEAKRIVSYMQQHFNITPSHWTHLISRLLAYIEPQDICRAIDRAASSPKQIKKPKSYIYKTSKKIARDRKNRMKREKSIRHDRYVIKKLQSMANRKLEALGPDKLMSLNKWLARSIPTHTAPEKLYEQAISNLTQCGKSINPVDFVISDMSKQLSKADNA